jgi:SNF2 family DNA or RNA helicase
MRRAVKFVLERSAAGLLLDPGLGKTSIMLAALKLLQRKNQVRSVLVVAPLRVVHSVWPEEISKWKDFNHFKVSILHGRKKDSELRKKSDLYIINPEGLPWLVRQKWKLPDMLIIDESTKFKHTRTKRFKLLKTMLPAFKRRYILTGTPAPNGLLDLFGQIYILDLGFRI